MEYNKEQERHLSRPACGALTLRFLLQFERLPPKSQLSLFSFFSSTTFQISMLSTSMAKGAADFSVVFILFKFVAKCWKRDFQAKVSHSSDSVKFKYQAFLCFCVFVSGFSRFMRKPFAWLISP